MGQSNVGIYSTRVRFLDSSQVNWRRCLKNYEHLKKEMSIAALGKFKFDTNTKNVGTRTFDFNAVSFFLVIYLSQVEVAVANGLPA